MKHGSYINEGTHSIQCFAADNCFPATQCVEGTALIMMLTKGF